MKKLPRALCLLFLFPVYVANANGHMLNRYDPVRWLYVKAKINLDNSVAVSWGVMAEPDNHWFEIERSEDDSTFDVIGSCAGRGANTGDNHYELTDNAARRGMTYYYRISLLGPDGLPRYSPLARIRLEQEDEKPVRLYPNPAAETVFVSINRELAQSAQITITDLSGVTRFSAGMEKLSANGSPLSIPVGAWPVGMYLIRVTNAYGNSQVARLLVKR